MSIIFRMHTPEDNEALVRFWSENSGWGEIDPAQWEHRFLNTPLGPASFALAVEEDTREIVGQFGFIPSLVSVNGRDVRACRPVATIVKENLRTDEGAGALSQLIFQMYTLASGALAGQGVGLIHFVPDPRWLRLFQMVPFFQKTAFPIYTFPLATPVLLPEGYQCEPLAYDDPRIDELWVEARSLYHSIVVRDRQALAWKNSHAPFELFGVVCRGRLVGLFSAIIKNREKKWQLCDVLSLDGGDSLRATLLAACRTAHDYWLSLPEENRELDQIASLATPLMEPVLKDLGFEKTDYNVHLIVHVLDEELPSDYVAPAHWYLSPNE